MPNPLQPIQKDTILQPLAAALMPFQIGSFPISDHNKRPRAETLGLALSVRHIGIYLIFMLPSQKPNPSLEYALFHVVLLEYNLYISNQL